MSASSPVLRALLLISLAEVFSVPTKTYLAYETKVWLPWFIKRVVLRKNIPRPPPLIEKEGVEALLG